MNRRLSLLIACLSVGMLTVAGLAQIPAPEPDEPPPVAKIPDAVSGRVLKKILRMFEGEKTALVEEDFGPNFLQQVPFNQLRETIAQIRAAEGSLKFKSLEPGASARGLVANVMGSTNGTSLQVFLALDPNEKIEGLLIRPTAPEVREPDVKSWKNFTARLGELAEKSACAVRELVPVEIDGLKQGEKPRVITPQADVLVHNASEPLAIGSAFKLWVLGAVAEQVKAKEFGWDDPLRIQEAIKSLPSGTMQNEREGKEFPIRLFAEKMVSISDNTATDHLIHLVSREACEKFMKGACSAGERNIPFLTTRDLFVLKLTPGNDLPEKYIAASPEARRAMLAPEGEVTTGTPQIILAAAWKAPRYIDRLEWFASGGDMCSTLAGLQSMSAEEGLTPIRAILSKNPGVPIDKKVFPYIGFKGGSEPGVMCLNWLLHRKDGRRFVVSIILNDTKKAIDEKKAIGLATRALEFLGEWDVAAEKR